MAHPPATSAPLRVVVTGCSGRIGKAAVRALAAGPGNDPSAGAVAHEVVGVDVVAPPPAVRALLRGGFILGGLQIHDADPGLGIILLPAGAILLVFALYNTARNAGR